MCATPKSRNSFSSPSPATTATIVGPRDGSIATGGAVAAPDGGSAAPAVGAAVDPALAATGAVAPVVPLIRVDPSRSDRRAGGAATAVPRTAVPAPDARGRPADATPASV